jgi:cephalosporin hydroxylase
MPRYRVTRSLNTVVRRASPKLQTAAYGAAERLAAAWYHRFYYFAADRTWNDTRWLGTPILKFPGDMWVYQEMLYELRPDWIIETGTYSGGSAHFMASICDLVGHGHIVTVDLEAQPNLPQHERITYVTGSSTAPEIVGRVSELTAGASTRLVILDSDHSYEHVRDELTIYSDLVTLGSYLIVEDTNLAGHPVTAGDMTRGPYEAVDEFLSVDTRFTRDRSREKFMVTFNPGGFLKRVE